MSNKEKIVVVRYWLVAILLTFMGFLKLTQNHTINLLFIGLMIIPWIIVTILTFSLKLRYWIIRYENVSIAVGLIYLVVFLLW
ncbi:MAG: hypothetical protein ACI312_01165 [Bacilli bacterium]